MLLKKGGAEHNFRRTLLTLHSIQNLTRTMVLREDQAKATYAQKVDFAKLRSELLSADSTESSTTRASHERLTNDLAKLNSRLRDEISRTQASVRLDLNLEKGRIREEANVQELKIKETETKIEQEVAGLREKLEGVKFQTLQWLMGVCTGKLSPTHTSMTKLTFKRYRCIDSWCLEIVDVDTGVQSSLRIPGICQISSIQIHYLASICIDQPAPHPNASRRTNECLPQCKFCESSPKINAETKEIICL